MKEFGKMITIVSGLPRSGTSMMMKMLEAGGMAVMTDNIRKADEDNPKGYYELEKVKKIKEDASWLQECAGKVFKMVSMLLYDLPADNSYKIIFMKRDLKEVLLSQQRMLQRLGQKTDAGGDLAALYEKHLNSLDQWLQRQRNIDLLYLSYHEVLENPDRAAELVSTFLCNSLEVSEMAKVVDKALYRNRLHGLS